MATHPSILAWKIPWTEGPGRLQSMGGKESDTIDHTHSISKRDKCLAYSLTSLLWGGNIV